MRVGYNIPTISFTWRLQRHRWHLVSWRAVSRSRSLAARTYSRFACYGAWRRDYYPGMLVLGYYSRFACYGIVYYLSYPSGIHRVAAASPSWTQRKGASSGGY